ncbi:hypothetical protein HYFRA_00014119 [Hymenoscyphus fraxineus]|uniref:Uncharacterized protein n=1 Tax=Hymenoscyphus fraxineus TaxID=746836 RepID=A0A9N9LBJ1_9HELO|nr:hypothetical protein HYFRA_00014119 [Hymenoscyphus fraxineus]
MTNGTRRHLRVSPVLQVLLGEVTVVEVIRATGHKMHVAETDVERDVGETVEEGRRGGDAGMAVAFLETVQAIDEPLSSFLEPFADGQGRVAKGSHEPRWVEHTG